MRKLGSAVCKDLYVAAILTSTAALGSITPACEGRQERKSFDYGAFNDDRSVLKRGQSNCLGGGW